MKLKALDQIHVSSVKADSLRPGEEFEVNDVQGAELLKAHPNRFEQIGGAKAEPKPANKAEPAPANKADNRRSGKGD